MLASGIPGGIAPGAGGPLPIGRALATLLAGGDEKLMLPGGPADELSAVGTEV